MDTVLAPVAQWLGPAWTTVWTLAKIVAIAIPLILCVAYLTLVERKVIGWMQVRIGPNRVGPLGLLQPFADVAKMLFKEIIVPSGASRYLFFIAPMLSLGPALAAWAVIPFADGLVLADINAGLLYILAMTSMGVYGIILAGWASNSKYAFLGCLRSAAQLVSYEIAIAFALFFLAEYMNMILVAALCAIMFLGGWLSPYPALNDAMVFGYAPLGDGLAWLVVKMAFILLIFLWIRATFPRYRYDQIMRLGWKVFIPVTLVWIAFLGAMMQTRYAYMFH